MTVNVLNVRRFNTCIRPPETSFADKAGGNGDLSDNLNGATPASWKYDRDALMCSLVWKMCPTAVICLI
jgi:hypothetical protein